MELLIIVDGIGKRYDIEKPQQCSDREMVEWIFAQLEQRPLEVGNRLEGHILGEINYICNIKQKKDGKI